MKSVLLIDAHPLFRDFLKDKLSAEKVDLMTATENRDAFTKMITTLPNLIIMDREIPPDVEADFLIKKLSDPNTATIPIIITGPEVDRGFIGSLARFGVIKYFTKPIKFDVLFESIGKVLHLSVPMDPTPCVMDIHRNGNIIFIEIARGLNREKLALLKFKLAEMIEKEEMDAPKIIIMLTSLDLTFVDGLNLEYLIDNVLSNPKVHRKNVKILSLSNFVFDLVDGHTEYAGVEVSKSLPKLMNTLVESTSSTSVPDLITETILSDHSSDIDQNSSIETRFSSDTDSGEENKNLGAVFSVAIIDGNIEWGGATANIFKHAGATTEVFTSGKVFLDNYKPGKYDVLILDVLIADQTGFTILKLAREDPLAPPIMVYSPSAQRDLIVRVLGAGASGYLMKPQKAEVLLNKVVSLLNK